MKLKQEKIGLRIEAIYTSLIEHHFLKERQFLIIYQTKRKLQNVRFTLLYLKKLNSVGINFQILMVHLEGLIRR